MLTATTPGKGTARPGRASDRVLKDLRHMIITLELPPGTVVTETSLVEVLGCSRTPLREALQRLSHEHLVVAVPRRGVSIADLSIVDFSSIVQAELGIDSALIRLAAERISDDQLSHMDDLLVRSDVAAADRDMEEVVDLDFQIHTAFGLASGNRFLLEFQEITMRLLARYVYLGFQGAGNAEGAIADHRTIVAALRTRDPSVCEDALCTHIKNGRDRMRSAL